METQELDFSKTQFHGETYDEDRDRDRLTGQLKRIFEVLQGGGKCTQLYLCEQAEVSFSALRNRISDLRIYHACNIKSEAKKGGLFLYQYLGQLSPAEHKAYLLKLRVERNAFGNKELWGAMMQAIFAYANKPDNVNHQHMAVASNKWAAAFAGEIGDIKYDVKKGERL